MSDVIMEISIPLDEDGFLEMECDFCKSRFMLKKDVYESEENLSFFCPICGLPNYTNTFFCPEVLEKAQQKVINYMYDEMDRVLEKTIRNINKSGFIKMSMNKPHKEPEVELYVPVDNYETVRKTCCEVDVKVRTIDKEIGIYCPICGGSAL